MLLPSPILPALFALLLHIPTSLAAKPKNAILLSDVQSLTLRSGAQTSHRRVSAVPQLKCISSPQICRLYEIDTMRCTNQGPGYDSEDVQWSCKASLPPELKLGSTDVICEGYSSSDDPYVLKGSCGVEYRLLLTAEGETKWPNMMHGGGSTSSPWKPSQETDWSAWLFGLVFVAVCVWILWSACVAQNDNRRRPAQRRPANNGGWFGPGFGGGGGGGGGGRRPPRDDPPPPYPGAKTEPQQQEQGWRPGFWSGLATGAAGGYVAGARNNRQRDDRSGLGHERAYGEDAWGAGPSRPSRPSGSNSGSASTERYEGTGFGGTSRR